MKFSALFVWMRARENAMQTGCTSWCSMCTVCAHTYCLCAEQKRERKSDSDEWLVKRERRYDKKEAQRTAWIVARYFLFGMSWMTTSSVKGYMTAAWCYDWLLPLLLPFECMHVSSMCVRERARAQTSELLCFFLHFFLLFYRKKKLLSRHVVFSLLLVITFFAHKLLTELMSILPKYSKRIKLN